MGKGLVILLFLILAVVLLYFYMSGFSADKWIRWGQYLGIVSILLFIVDELFKDL